MALLTICPIEPQGDIPVLPALSVNNFHFRNPAEDFVLEQFISHPNINGGLVFIGDFCLIS